MLKILFSEEEMPYTVHDERMKYLLVNGVINRSGGNVDIPVPIYKKRLITAFRPLFNGEGQYYPCIKEDFNQFYLKNEGLQEGYYVVFSNVHQDEDKLKEKEKIEGKTIYSYIIRTNLKAATGNV